MPGPFNVDKICHGLAFSTQIDALTKALAHGTVVVQSPPGSGKTTLVPPVVANFLSKNQNNQLLVTSPRRLTARAAAERLSSLEGEKVGDRTGYTIRGESRRSPKTIVEFLTPGILLRRLVREPDLPGVGAVIIDEVHERSLDADLIIALIQELRILRDDLLVILMSATLNNEKFSAVLGEPPIVYSQGAQYPVQVNYRSWGAPRVDERGVKPGFLNHVAKVVSEAVFDDIKSDALVFVPGRSDISRLVEILSQQHPDMEVLPLFSGVDRGVYRRVLRGRKKEERRRIIIATNVAESSLTVPGVQLVIDAALSREVRWDSHRNMRGLITTQASHSSCDQRAGRAGRLGPGQAYRCVSEAEYATAPLDPSPEIAHADLTTAALLLACWGTPGGKGLTMLDSFPSKALEVAHRELEQLGAVDSDLKPTELGQIISTLPLPPRTAAALLRAAPECGIEVAAEVIALASLDLRIEDAFLPRIYKELRRGNHPQTETWKMEVERLKGHLDRSGYTGSSKEVETKSLEETLGYVLSLGVGRVAKRDGESFLLTSGTRAAAPEGPLRSYDWIVVTKVARSNTRIAQHTGAVIQAAAPLPWDVLTSTIPIDQKVVSEVVQGTVRQREERRVGSIIVSTVPQPPPPMTCASTIGEHIDQNGLDVLPWNEDAIQLRARLALLHSHYGGGWPNVSDEYLQQDLSWLTRHITEARLSRVPLTQALMGLVWDKQHALAQLAPNKLKVPSGRDIRLHYKYPVEARVTASVKLQECFGWVQSPRILEGQLPVTIELLSPANRPLAVTQDLEFFWNEVYPQVRAENRARYAKHPWPEDPWNHEPTAATKRKLRRQ